MRPINPFVPTSAVSTIGIVHISFLAVWIFSKILFSVFFCRLRRTISIKALIIKDKTIWYNIVSITNIISVLAITVVILCIVALFGYWIYSNIADQLLLNKLANKMRKSPRTTKSSISTYEAICCNIMIWIGVLE